jgi:hypothetical protein
MADRFGDRRNYASLRMIACLMEFIRDPMDPNTSWLDDPYVFDQFFTAATLILRELRPAGDATAARREHWEPFKGKQLATVMMGHVELASAELPLERRRFPAEHIKADLGDDVVKRMGKQTGTDYVSFDLNIPDDMARVARNSRKDDK